MAGTRIKAEFMIYDLWDCQLVRIYENDQFTIPGHGVGPSRLSDVAETPLAAAASATPGAASCKLRDAVRTAVANCMENDAPGGSPRLGKFFPSSGPCIGANPIRLGTGYAL